MIGKLFNKLLNFENLSYEESLQLMDCIMEGQASAVQIGGILTALRMKKETIDEISGMATSMRNHAELISPKGDVIDTCGTGGDLSHSFNISTTAAIIVAACGVNVAKHGNRNISSACGCADLLEALEIKIDLTPAQVEETINNTGFGFMFAPRFHGAMKHALVPRKELAIRTIFNILGPLTNPAMAKFQVLGVFKPELTQTIAHVLKNLGTKKALVVHGLDGLDEISISAPTIITELYESGQIKTYEFNPESIGMKLATKKDILGGSKTENALITTEILTGIETGPKSEIAILNAAASLVTANKAQDFREGIKMARSSISGGSAIAKLNQIKNYTQRFINNK